MASIGRESQDKRGESDSKEQPPGWIRRSHTERLKRKERGFEMTKRAEIGMASEPNHPQDSMTDKIHSVPLRCDPGNPQDSVRPNYFLTSVTEWVLADVQRLAYLRTKLASARNEEDTLASELASTSLNPTRKRQAARRYSAVVAGLGRTTHQLQELVIAVKLGRNCQLQKASQLVECRASFISKGLSDTLQAPRVIGN